MGHYAQRKRLLFSEKERVDGQVKRLALSPLGTMTYWQAKFKFVSSEKNQLDEGGKPKRIKRNLCNAPWYRGTPSLPMKFHQWSTVMVGGIQFVRGMSESKFLSFSV